MHTTDTLAFARATAAERQRRADQHRLVRTVRPVRSISSTLRTAVAATLIAGAAGTVALTPPADAATEATSSQVVAYDTYTMGRQFLPGRADGWYVIRRGSTGRRGPTSPYR